MDNVTCDTADLTWKSPDSDGGLPIKHYIIEMRPSSKMVWSKIGKVDADKTSFTAQDLKEGTDYYFRVIAVNDEGDSDALETKDTIRPLKKICKYNCRRYDTVGNFMVLSFVITFVEHITNYACL